MLLNPQDGVGLSQENTRDGGSFYAKLHVEGRNLYQSKTLSLGFALELCELY